MIDSNNCFITNNMKKDKKYKINGCYVERDGERFYKIENYHLMPPFFMSIVSDSDHWMFISSNGALSAGRKDPDNALFPYYNDDQITDSHEITGSKTIVYIQKDKKAHLWKPFSDRCSGLYDINRNIYKNVYGNKLIFEEINNDLAVSFKYGWFSSDKYGFIKRSEIHNHGKQDLSIRIVDGIQNILPYGVTHLLQIQMSTLTNAYKKNELLPDSGIGIFYLSSIPSDKAEPSEGLKATTAWSTALPEAAKLISSNQLDLFRKGEPIVQEADVRAARGAYLINSCFDLASGKHRSWYLAAEINQDSSDIIALEKHLSCSKHLQEELEQDIQRGTDNLIKIVANADGLQATADELTSGRHFSNVLFNIMRGGIFNDNYRVEKKDLQAHISHMNKNITHECKSFIDSLAQTCNYSDVIQNAANTHNPDLQRICYEYLPLTFSRRHGDPSRPWNLFSIQTKNEDGSKRLYYQGNWRDIFQNWEALSISFPEYVESMICKFVNASTADGYNPYRITRAGIDWEVLDPKDPWSHIGYWGDHQIIYLLKLLEISHKYHPGKLNDFLTQDIFAYANIPYRIKSYRDLLKDPHNTIDFDDHLEHEIKKRVKQIGSDGKLLPDNDKGVYRVNLTEKLLVSVLAKVSNFIPEAGIWLNTQRPEWNDANNALVGYGVSMVTLYYLRRFLSFAQDLFADAHIKTVTLSQEVATLLTSISHVLQDNKELLKGKFSDSNRKKILDLLGSAGSDYRKTIYANGFSGDKTQVSPHQLNAFFEITLDYFDHTIKANKRSDGLYHAYNLMKVVNNDEVSIRHLYEMLEGQVAVLSCGLLSPEEVVELMDALRAGSMYRSDQYSYILYPDRQLPRFMEKNIIPKQKFEQSQLLKMLIKDGNSHIVKQDINGGFHFNATFRNANELKQALKELSHTTYKELATKEQKLILGIFEEIFDHQSFTGRSGTFYSYEGLGCIYWHMVSKLVLALEENYYWAVKKNSQKQTLAKLVEHYYVTRAGIGLNKSPELYGAFPTDPYSHTPAHAGAKQPGMTGQVKEDILSRWGELGINVEEGYIRFDPILLRKSEFVQVNTVFNYYNIEDMPSQIELQRGSLAFTYCKVPFVYHISDQAKITVTYAYGRIINSTKLALDEETSAAIFQRTGKVARIDVYVQPALK